MRMTGSPIPPPVQRYPSSSLGTENEVSRPRNSFELPLKTRMLMMAPLCAMSFAICLLRTMLHTLTVPSFELEVNQYQSNPCLRSSNGIVGDGEEARKGCVVRRLELRLLLQIEVLDSLTEAK